MLVPIAVLLMGGAVALVLAGHTAGAGPSAAGWILALFAAGVAGFSRPGWTLVMLVGVLPITPYLRYSTWIGGLLPEAVAAFCLTGAALSPSLRLNRSLEDERGPIAAPTVAFASLLLLSVVLVLLQRSPFVATLIGGGVFANHWASLGSQSTLPVLRACGLLVGPVAGLVGLSLWRRREPHSGLEPEQLVTVVLVSGLISLLVACGQAFVPNFPVPSLFPGVSGFYHNPVGLALLMTLIAPLAVVVSFDASRQGRLRPLGFATLITGWLVFVSIGQRSAHLGVALGVTVALTGWAVISVRRGRADARRVLVVAAISFALLVVGLALGVSRTAQWQQSLSTLVDSPISTRWLGIGERGETNRMAFLMVAERPLGGYGIGGFEAALPAFYYQVVLSQERYGPLARGSEHSILNHPLHMAVDFGVFGLVGNLWLLAAFLVPAVGSVSRSAGLQPLDRGDLLGLGCAAGFGSALLLSIWTGEWMYDAAVSVPAFSLISIALIATPSGGRHRLAARWAMVALPLGHALMFVFGL